LERGRSRNWISGIHLRNTGFHFLFMSPTLLAICAAARVSRPRCIGIGIIGIIVGIIIIVTTVDFPSGSCRTACETRWPQKQRAPDRRLFCIRSYLYSQLAGVAALSSSS